jgi:hypothetical protein
MKSHLPVIQVLCKVDFLGQLYLFGTARGEGWDVENSNVGFMAEMLQIEPLKPGRASKKLLLYLEELFKWKVDLEIARLIWNSFFLKK